MIHWDGVSHHLSLKKVEDHPLTVLSLPCHSPLIIINNNDDDADNGEDVGKK